MFRALLVLFFIIPLAHLAIGQDSLSGKTFKELDKLSVDAFEAGNIELSRIYSKYQIGRAKQEQDSVRIAFSFYTYMFDQDLELALKYCDSAIYFTENSNHKSHPTYGYLVKSRRLIESHRYEEAMTNLVVAYDYAKKKNNFTHLSAAKQKMGNIKSFLGDYQEALNLFKEDYHYTVNEDKTANFKRNLEVALYNLSIIYLKNRMLDSARLYSKIGLEKATFKSNRYYKFLGLNAEVDYYSGNYDASLDSLTRYLDKFKGNSLANKFYYIGKIYDKQGSRDLAEKYFRRVDSIVTTDQELFMEVKDVYHTLADYYRKRDNDSIQIFFIDKYIWADSILTSQRAQINPLMELKFDNPRILEERQTLLNKVKNKDKWISISSLIGFILLIIGAYFYYSHHRLRRKLTSLIEKGVEKGNEKTEEESSVKLIIPPNIVEEIKVKLNEFEKSALIKDPTLNQASLANHMVTNSTYLSNYINYFKGRNFPTYLKELRIRIAVERIKNEPKLLKYSIKGLASEFGFATSSSFSRAFTKFTGIKPSQFLNELNKD